MAVLPVVFYHAGVSGFGGGYVGVDIFFVISGFLITSIIASEVREGRFSILSFYERRVRRIFPALFAMFAVTIPLAAALLLPADFKEFGQSLVAASAFLANILFWKTGSGYFAGPAEEKPLLHTWSLAVEEQYYIFFPLLLLAIWRFFGGRFLLWLVPLALLSFAMSVLSVKYQPTAAFYLLHSRAWELFVGSFLALGFLPEIRNRFWREALGLLGLALIAVSVFTFTNETPFPGIAALLPCAGAALLIGTPGTLTARVLSHEGIVFFGLISYSLYLWHWPLLVFAEYYLIRDLNGAEVAAVLLVSVLVSVFSWKFIEQPFRGKRGLLTRRQLFPLAGGAMALAIVVGLAGHATNGMPQRLSADVAALSREDFRANTGNESGVKCLGSVEDSREKLAAVRDDRLCPLGNGGRPEFVMWGDSHAEAIRAAMSEAATRKGMSGAMAAYGDCPPALGVVRSDQPANQCRDFNKVVLDYIERNQIRLVILHARWPFYAEGTHYKSEPGGDFTLVSSARADGNREILEERLAATIRELKRLGADVVLMSSVPDVGHHVPGVLARNIHYGRETSLNETIAPTMDEHKARTRAAWQILRSLSAEYGLALYDPAPLLCETDVCPVVTKDGVPLYADTNHVSRHGAQRLIPLFEDILDAPAAPEVIDAGI